MFAFDGLFKPESLSTTVAADEGNAATAVGAGAGPRPNQYYKVPSFEVELSRVDGPGVVFATFRGKGVGGAGRRRNGTMVGDEALGTDVEEVATA